MKYLLRPGNTSKFAKLLSKFDTTIVMTIRNETQHSISILIYCHSKNKIAVVPIMIIVCLNYKTNDNAMFHREVPVAR